ncbi:hypothetical protein MMC30_005847 [Trapelia coarctata]|nr:hypothetical protein [Trapelia coarctata]
MWGSHNGKALGMMQGSASGEVPRGYTMVEQVASQMPESSSAGLDTGSYHANAYTFEGMPEGYRENNQSPTPFFSLIDEQSVAHLSHTRPDLTGQDFPPGPSTTPARTPGKGVAKPQKIVVLKYRPSPQSQGHHLFQGSPGRGQRIGGGGSSEGIHSRVANLEVLLRNNRTNNRSARGQIDHDAMEGLPVRQWRKAPAVVNTAPPRENSSITNMRNAGWKELPMPRGSELYSPMSQALLRAARMGVVNRPPPPPLEDEKELGEDEDAEGDIDTGFVAVKWTQVSKEMEEPEMEFLAKRRKGLPLVYGGLTGSQSNPIQMRKIKVRRINEDGKSYVYEVLAPEGTTVEGEVVEGDEVTTEAPAPGTIVEGVGVANAEGVVIAGDQVVPTPPRRRPPPPKRKAKGPGRGRKKRPTGTDGASAINGTLHPSSAGVEGRTAGAEGGEDSTLTGQGTTNEDIEIGGDSMMQDGEEGSEDDDEEGDEGDDGDREEGELSPTPEADAPGSVSGSPFKQPPPTIIEPTPSTNLPSSTYLNVTDTMNREPSSSPDLPLAAAQMANPPFITIESVTETTSVPPSDLPGLANLQPVTVEDPTALSSTVAELPSDHDSLERSAAPQAPESVSVEDLYGSLERHLNEKS